MTPAALLSALRSHGFELAADGADLVCRGPVERLTPKLRANLNGAKADLLRLLAAEARVRGNPLVAKALATFDGSRLVGMRLRATGEAWRVE